MASKPMNKHRLRLLAMTCVVALAVLTFTHMSYSQELNAHQTFGGKGTAEEDQAWFVMNRGTGPGDVIEVAWEWIAHGFRPVFGAADFYIIEAQETLDISTANILFHGTENAFTSCCDQGRLTFTQPGDIDSVRMVWRLEYTNGYAPLQPAQDGTALGGIVLDPSPTDSGIMDQQLRYIEAFLDAQGADGPLGDEFQHIRVTRAEGQAVHLGFMVGEALLAVAAIALWAASLARPAAPDADGVIGLVQKGVRHLQAQLRLHLVLGPLLFIAGIFGTEAMDNGAFGVNNPGGIADEWVIAVMLGLWLFSLVIWIVGLVRVLKALRHYNKTQEPDLGGVGA